MYHYYINNLFVRNHSFEGLSFIMVFLNRNILFVISHGFNYSIGSKERGGSIYMLQSDQKIRADFAVIWSILDFEAEGILFEEMFVYLSLIK